MWLRFRLAAANRISLQARATLLLKQVDQTFGSSAQGENFFEITALWITHQHHIKQKGKERQRAQNNVTKRIDIELELKNKQALALKIEFNNAGLDSGVSQD